MKYLFLLFVPTLAFADDLSTQDLLTQIFQTVTQFGGMSWAAKVIAIITLLIASTKVSVLREKLWDKLGAAKVLVAPILGLAAGFLMQFAPGSQALTLPAALAYLMAGGGAVLFHEVLDAIKEIPGIGPMYLALINFVNGMLGGPKA